MISPATFQARVTAALMTFDVIVAGVRIVQMVRMITLFWQMPVYVAQLKSGVLIELLQFDITGGRFHGHRLQVIVSYDVLQRGKRISSKWL